jgi:hypothetical protein
LYVVAKAHDGALAVLLLDLQERVVDGARPALLVARVVGYLRSALS